MRKQHVNPPGPPLGDTKVCAKCLEAKALTEFYKDKMNKSGYRPYCKDCSKRASKERYDREGSPGKLNNKARLATRTELKRRLVAEAGGKCTRCGYREFISGLDFHHIQGEKEATMANLLMQEVGKRGDWLEVALKEAKKCILLCRNCHGALHAGEWKQEEIGQTLTDK
jgi:hypothetical protein